MHWTRQSSVYLTVATLLFLVIYAYFQFSEYKKFTQYVEHTYKVLNTTERLEGSVKMLMAWRRGYIIEPTPEIMKLVITERQVLTGYIDSLTVLTQDNHVQLANLHQLQAFIQESGTLTEGWFGAYGEPVISLDSMKADIYTSQYYLDRVFRELNQIKDIEQELLQIRSDFQHDTGQTVPLMLLITGLTTLTILIYAFYLMSVDLKERLKAKEALEKNVQELNLANEELERFAFIASHNLKEPLRKARTFISRILPAVSATDSIYPNLQKVELSMGRLQMMLDDLLIFTRLLHHQENKELLNLNKIIQRIADEIRQDETGIPMELEMEELPTITGYAAQVALTFRHLFSNALKYRKADGHVSIRISAQYDAGSTTQLILFSDNGIGFDSSFSQKIFEVFGRLHSKDVYEGTGIGLAICRRVMFNHNGLILVESTPGIGTTFSLHFPE